MGVGTMSGTQEKVRCTLSAVELDDRRAAVTKDLFDDVEAVRELPDGYAFRFAFDTSRARRLVDFIAAERSCCQFFTFELVFEPSAGPIWLRLRGPDGTKAFLEELLPQAATSRG
jgi:hypothetical protein